MRQCYWRNSTIPQSWLARFFINMAMKIDGVEWHWDNSGYGGDTYTKKGKKNELHTRV